MAGLLALPSPALGALAPHYQRVAELHAVIEAALSALDDLMPIERVEFVSHDVYEVRAGDCALTVRIVEIDPKRQAVIMGPRRFEAVAEEPECE